MSLKLQEIPFVICLVGSTRFKDEYQEANSRLTLNGYVVLSVGFFQHSSDPSATEISDEKKEELDRLHLHKIDMADGIYVVNPGGYVGESTKSEIRYALDKGRAIFSLEDLKVSWDDTDIFGEKVTVDYPARDVDL